jgi:hypothetical protein
LVKIFVNLSIKGPLNSFEVDSIEGVGSKFGMLLYTEDIGI